jgi:hypothetical protein
MSGYSQSHSDGSERRSRAFLVIAHPGHELRLHRWLEIAQPDVWVLTDGSGRTQRSRVDSTTQVLQATGARPGPVYGQTSDADLYNAVLTGDYGQFTELVDRLATELIRHDADCVAGDAEEGYNPAHDTCRLVINAAVQLVNRRAGKQIANYDFTLAGPPTFCPKDLQSNSMRLNLDEEDFSRKLAAARNYPELQAEVEAALKGPGFETFREHYDLVERSRSSFGVADASDFRVECLRPVDSRTASAMSFNGKKPFYEAYGEKQVTAGHYRHVLRYREHILPLAAALDSHVERSR